MAESKRDWLAITISLVSAAIAAASAGYNILLHHDDIRLVVGNSLNVARENQDFTLDRQQELTFINSGNRPAVISSAYGSLVLATEKGSEQSQCENLLSLAKSIVLDGSPIILKPGEIQVWHANISISYPWKKDNNLVRYHEDSAKEAAGKHIVCFELYLTTPDSSSFRWVQPLYLFRAGNGEKVELFDKDRPLSVLQGMHWGIR